MKRKKIAPYKQVTQQDINNIKSLHDTGHFSITGICDITKRGWSTVDFIIKSGFDLKEYKQLIRRRKDKEKTKLQDTKPLTFSPEPSNDVQDNANVDPYDNDVLNYMHDLQQEQAKRLMKKTERDEAIHKIRNGLQELSEGLGALL